MQNQEENSTKNFVKQLTLLTDTSFLIIDTALYANLIKTGKKWPKNLSLLASNKN
jgi:hypothetical protein